MIVPMKKCLIVMLESDRRSGLEALRDLGLVHPEAVTGSGAALDRIKGERELYERALGVLAGIKPPGGGEAIMDSEEPLSIAERLEGLIASEKEKNERIAFLTRERDRLSSFGNFDPESLEALSVSGYEFKLHALPEKGRIAFPEGVLVMDLGREKGKRYSLTASPRGTDAQGLPEAVHLPDAGLTDMAGEIARLEAEAAAIKAEKSVLALSIPALRGALARARQNETFENLRSGMSEDSSLAYITGWIPDEDSVKLESLAKKQGWGLSLDVPGDDELPPTKVKSTFLVRMVQPVFDFLGTVPNYREYEISVWFLLFFSVFFAMIFGDAGYGSLMLAAGIGIWLRSAARKKKAPDVAYLLLLLAATTTVWGALTASWFSLPPESLPPFLKMLAVDWIAGWNPDSAEHVQIICFVLGLTQLSLAHVKNIMRDLKARSLKFLGQLGSLALVVGLFSFVLNLVIDAEKFPIRTYSLFLVGGGFVLNFAFSNFETGLGQSLLDGLKNIISVILGTVSVFADIVSYIRLWAVGMAGVAIAQTVNGMVGGAFKGAAGSAIKLALAIVVGVVGLGFGHGLNLIMNVLSVVVHGIRLNMLEFSGHLGMDWSGYKYKPFAGAENGLPEKGKESK
jgi:V/A-type H+/Na+-transporting ATPase subunit I